MDIRHILNLIESADAPRWSPSDDEINLYMYGGCYDLARAILSLTGLPLVGLYEPGPDGEMLEHVMNQVGPDRFVDINGVRSRDEVVQDLQIEHEIRDAKYWQWQSITREDISRAIRSGHFEPSTPTRRAAAAKTARALIVAFNLPAKKSGLAPSAATALPQPAHRYSDDHSAGREAPSKGEEIRAKREDAMAQQYAAWGLVQDPATGNWGPPKR